MKVLLTSGGTRTALDEVRFLTNMSTGTFGNHICQAFLKAGHDVTFLYAKGSKCPHELRIDLTRVVTGEDKSNDGMFEVEHDSGNVVAERADLLSSCRDRYNPISYNDFNDYAAKLVSLLEIGKPDIVVLAAAVSDYAPVKREGKIRSDLKSMEIELVRTPKLIGEVKQIHPECFLVGFKLLVGSTQDQLEEAMEKQIRQAHCDMVVGNDLRDIKASQHRLTKLSLDGICYQSDVKPGAELAKELVEEIVRDAKTTFGEHSHLGAPGRLECMESNILAGTCTSPRIGETYKEFEQRFFTDEGERYVNRSEELFWAAAQAVWLKCRGERS